MNGFFLFLSLFIYLFLFSLNSEKKFSLCPTAIYADPSGTDLVVVDSHRHLL